MFRAIILPIFRGWPATSWVHYTTSCNTQSSAPEDGQNNCPKHVKRTGIINKRLLLQLVGCLYYLYFIIFFWDLLNNLNIPLQNVVYFITLPFWFIKYSHFTKMMCYYLNFHFQGQRVIMQAACNFVWFLRCHTFQNQAERGNSNAVHWYSRGSQFESCQ